MQEEWTDLDDAYLEIFGEHPDAETKDADDNQTPSVDSTLPLTSGPRPRSSGWSGRPTRAP
ncbi:hypothetical protein GCM10022242_19770 [Nocardioides panacisoli]|uniref:Uncharacterized protein n=1 Tax=Nocardioides panacisoli TaxID=627624 RepID=A0ABP7IGE6_9ACTN